MKHVIDQGAVRDNAIRSARSRCRTVPFGRLDKGSIEQDIAQFAKQPNRALILTAGSAGTAQSKLIIDLAAPHVLPTIYPFGFHVKGGGLAAYGLDTVEMFRRGAEYVNRILRRKKPSDLPVQQPTKYELLINLKTAKR